MTDDLTPEQKQEIQDFMNKAIDRQHELVAQENVKEFIDEDPKEAMAAFLATAVVINKELGMGPEDNWQTVAAFTEMLIVTLSDETPSQH